jgi:hypothetical protein
MINATLDNSDIPIACRRVELYQSAHNANCKIVASARRGPRQQRRFAAVETTGRRRWRQAQVDRLGSGVKRRAGDEGGHPNFIRLVGKPAAGAASFAADFKDPLRQLGAEWVLAFDPKKLKSCSSIEGRTRCFKQICQPTHGRQPCFQIGSTVCGSY